MENQVRKYIEQQNMLQKGDTVVVGVSGGPDSLCLLYILFLLRDIFQMRLICAHIDHQARPGDSEEDAAFVQAFCARYAIPFVCKTINVKKLAKEQKINFHQVARSCRYDFFQEIMEQYGASKLAIAHHGEDFAETFMMRMVRQTAYEKWFTLLPKRAFAGGMLIRPLLWATKQEILEYLQMKKLDFRVDGSNDETYYTRNRFRKKLLPFIYEENPNFLDGLFRTQQEVLSDEAYLMEQTEAAFSQVVQVQRSDEVILDVEQLFTFAFPLQRRLIRVVLDYLYFSRETSFSYAYIAEILVMLGRKKGYAEMALSDGVYVTASYEKARIGVGLPAPLEVYEMTVSGEGRYVLPNGDVIQVSTSMQVPDESAKDLYWVYAKDSCFPYIIRTRQSGDRVLLEDRLHYKKLNRLFIDAKIPLPARDSWPLLVDASGQILWIPLLKKVRLSKEIEQQEILYIFQYIKEKTEEVQV